MYTDGVHSSAYKDSIVYVDEYSYYKYTFYTIV